MTMALIFQPVLVFDRMNLHRCQRDIMRTCAYISTDMKMTIKSENMTKINWPT